MPGTVSMASKGAALMEEGANMLRTRAAASTQQSLGKGSKASQNAPTAAAFDGLFYEVGKAFMLAGDVVGAVRVLERASPECARCRWLLASSSSTVRVFRLKFTLAFFLGVHSSYWFTL